LNLPPALDRAVASRSVVLLLVWVAFLADLMIGAGLLLSKRALLFNIGVAMVLAACLGMAGVTLYYYVQQRRASTPPKQGSR
jgi:hypothetical protein